MEDYSNRELDEKFREIHDKLDLILTQTTKTNGRVSRLEDWKAYVLGGFAVISFIVIPLMIYTYNHDDTKTQNAGTIINK